MYVIANQHHVMITRNNTMRMITRHPMEQTYERAQMRESGVNAAEAREQKQAGKGEEMDAKQIRVGKA
jgi:hypothetical protein